MDFPMVGSRQPRHRWRRMICQDLKWRAQVKGKGLDFKNGKSMEICSETWFLPLSLVFPLTWTLCTFIVHGCIWAYTCIILKWTTWIDKYMGISGYIYTISIWWQWVFMNKKNDRCIWYGHLSIQMQVYTCIVYIYIYTAYGSIDLTLYSSHPTANPKSNAFNML